MTVRKKRKSYLNYKTYILKAKIGLENVSLEVFSRHELSSSWFPRKDKNRSRVAKNSRRHFQFKRYRGWYKFNRSPATTNISKRCTPYEKDVTLRAQGI